MDTSNENTPVATTIYSQTKRELDEFFNKYIHIAGTSKQESARYLDSRNRKYMYNQWETINLIDLYYNSKFESGVYDTEGQRKIFLNLCKFRTDVASKQIDIDVKDFNFIPEEGVSEWPAYFQQKEFRAWAKDDYFGELLNKCVAMFPRYGWLVLKEVNGHLEYVPLQTLRNQQDAKDLQSARYIIIEHPHMTKDEMKAMRGWNTSSITLKPGQTDTVYERYGFVTVEEYNKYATKKLKMDNTDMIDCLTILTLKETKDGPTGNVLFMEQIDKRPFQDVKWSEQHGRLMGIGEVENQFENQIAANLSFNLFRRQLLWSAKKIFQSPHEGIAKNLVRDVKDGDVLQISSGGNITQIDMANKAIGDFTSFSKIVEDNANQKSFTFESSTGASMASGTPFRLGVLLSNTVNSHFELKKEQLGLFFKRGMQELIIPKWKEQFTSSRIISMFNDEEGFDTLKELLIHIKVNDEIANALNEQRLPNRDLITEQIRNELENQKYLFIKIPDSYYDDIKYKVTLTITGEEIDLPKKIETLTNLYTSLKQTGDSRSEKVLKKILSLVGENLDIVAGINQQVNQQGNPNMGSLPRPTINPNSLPVNSAKTL